MQPCPWDEQVRADLLERILRGVDWFLDPGNDDVWQSAVYTSNQVVAGLLGAFMVADHLGAARSRLLHDRLDVFLERSQSPAGYPYEDRAVDFGYTTGVALGDVALLHALTDDDRLLQLTSRFLEFCSYNYLWEPDGSGFVVNGGFGSRQAVAYLDADRTDERSVIDLLGLVRDRVPTANAFLSTAEGRAAIRTAWAEDPAPIPPLELGRVDPGRPRAVLAAAEFPTSTARVRALDAFPYRAGSDFVEQRHDTRFDQHYAWVRRPGYYTAAFWGERRGRQQSGLGFLHHPDSGTFVCGQSEPALSWGAVAGDQEEAETVLTGRLEVPGAGSDPRLTLRSTDGAAAAPCCTASSGSGSCPRCQAPSSSTCRWSCSRATRWSGGRRPGAASRWPPGRTPSTVPVSRSCGARTGWSSSSPPRPRSPWRRSRPSCSCPVRGPSGRCASRPGVGWRTTCGSRPRRRQRTAGPGSEAAAASRAGGDRDRRPALDPALDVPGRPAGTRDLLGQYGWLLLSRVLSAVLQSATLLLLARWAGPATFGLAASVTGILLLIGTLADFGLSNLLLREQSLDERSGTAAVVLRLNLLISTGATVAVGVGLVGDRPRHRRAGAADARPAGRVDGGGEERRRLAQPRDRRRPEPPGDGVVAGAARPQPAAVRRAGPAPGHPARLRPGARCRLRHREPADAVEHPRPAGPGRAHLPRRRAERRCPFC